MNKYIKLAVCLITVAFCFTSCGNFDEINTDPDVPTRVTAAMLASGGIKIHRATFIIVLDGVA